MVSVNKVGTESISTIRALAEKIWRETYTPILSPEQMDYMLDLFYSESSLQKQMKDGHQFIIGKDNSLISGLNANGEHTAIGFASYSQKMERYKAYPGQPGGMPVEVSSNIFRLHKIYVDPLQQGKGIGKLLIGFIINDISTHDATDLELNVNRSNKALHFYETIGFKIIREEDIDIGNGFFMNDYVLNLAL